MFGIEKSRVLGRSVKSGVLLKNIEPIQYTSYANFDEGWRAQNLWFNYTPPSNPAAVSELDITSANYWFRLKNDIKVGANSNKMRFVDVDGVQTFSGTNNKNLICIDKLSGLGIYRPQATSANWANALINANNLSIIVNGVTYDEWYLITPNEYINIFAGQQTNNNSLTDLITGVPVCDQGGVNAWLSQTLINAPTLGFIGYPYGLYTGLANKTDVLRPIFITKQTRNLITAP
jgi:hypothetical protein